MPRDPECDSLSDQNGLCVADASHDFPPWKTVYNTHREDILRCAQRIMPGLDALDPDGSLIRRSGRLKKGETRV
jgi:hypothetical protein